MEGHSKLYSLFLGWLPVLKTLGSSFRAKKITVKARAFFGISRAKIKETKAQVKSPGIISDIIQTDG
jgi:hypothetical protein